MTPSPVSLLDQAWDELAAAEALCLQGSRHARAAAVHLHRCWQAVASLREREQGRETTQPVTAACLLDDELLGIPADQAFAETFAALAAAVRGGPADDEPPVAEAALILHRQLLHRALGAAERCLSSGRGPRRARLLRAARRYLRIGLLGYAAVVAVFVVTLAIATLAARHAHDEEAQRREQSQQPPPERPLGELVVAGPALSKPLPAGTNWAAYGTIQFRSALVVALGASTPASRIEIALDHNDVYELAWLLGGKEVGERVIVGPSDQVGGGLFLYRVATGAREIDTVVIAARSGDGMYSVGHVIPISP